ncbi:VOC family protein [Xylophilus sp. GOD-11R]|uniref:VOC family protein n=1 Tax=Xylophilus sp. GOD-11R TaxID=3089814 RepID=UPI00298C582F|nr:VOC family protein [Xylophilus sp. GOD-11R]WPB58857.1 VOC family protein [Xylophilus sp. GOD-11R]
MPSSLTPYLTFPGTTREAYAFYEKSLGATINAMLTYADAPRPETPPEGCGPMPTGDGIMHAALTLPGGGMLFAGDQPPGMPFDGVKGAMLALQYDTVDEAQKAFAALSEGGQVTMPLGPVFWAKTFGMATDRFGIGWAVGGGPIPLGTGA